MVKREPAEVHGGNSRRLATEPGWVRSGVYEQLLADVLRNAGIGDENRRALPAPQDGVKADAKARGNGGEQFTAVYVISVAARMADMHPNTLRKYDREGLVSPSRTEGRQRLYSDTAVERLRVVRTLSEQYDLNLNGVRLVMDIVRLVSGVVSLLETSGELSEVESAGVAASELRRLLAHVGAQ